MKFAQFVIEIYCCHRLRFGFELGEKVSGPYAEVDLLNCNRKYLVHVCTKTC